MQTDSSASRTYLASASASECTTTVLMPSSRQARSMRSAISPRLAIRTLSKSWPDGLLATVDSSEERRQPAEPALSSADHHQRLAVLDRLTVLDQDRFHDARAIGLDLVHELHGLDDAERVAHLHLVANV